MKVKRTFNSQAKPSDDFDRKLRIVLIISLVLTTLLIIAGKATVMEIRKNEMIEGSKASSRLTDGSVNEVIMLGDSGFVGSSGVFAKYLKDGYISITGLNCTENYQWKKLSDFNLSPGTYTFTGLSDVDPESVQLQLDYPESQSYKWYFLWDEDIQFTIEEAKEAELYVRVFPGASVDVVARPAVYRDE